MIKNNKIFGIGIIGCGLIGHKRADSLGEKGRLIACADIDKSRSDRMAKRFNAKSFQDWQELLELKEIDIVIVCTLHDTLSEISEAALLKGKNVLVEKPGARNLQELERLKSEVEAAGKTLVPVKIYFKDALIKCQIAVGSGKNLRDKRQDLKKQVAKREADQALKNALKR